MQVEAPFHLIIVLLMVILSQIHPLKAEEFGVDPLRSITAQLAITLLFGKEVEFVVETLPLIIAL